MRQNISSNKNIFNNRYSVVAILITLLLLGAEDLSAQNSNTISGVIIDQDRLPVEFVTVLLYTNGSSKESKFTLSDIDGKFTLPYTSGLDSLTLSHLTIDKLTLLPQQVIPNSNYSDTISVNYKADILSEVTVKGSSISSSVGKDSYNVTPLMRKGSVKTDDILDKIEGVKIDKYSQAVSVDNSDEVLLLVNGMKKSASYVRNLSPKVIKRVDIIRDITGRYSTSYSAIVDIILKSDIKGYDIYLNNQSFLNFDNSQGDLFVFNNLDVGFNSTRGKLSIYGSGKNRIEDFKSVMLSKDKGVTSQLSLIGNTLEDGAVSRTNNNTFTLGGDLTLNGKNSLSLELNYDLTPLKGNRSKTFMETQFTDYESSENSNRYIDIYENSNSSDNFYSTLFYRSKISERLNLNSDITYSNYSGDATYTIVSTPSIEDIDISESRTEITEKRNSYIDGNIEITYNISDRWTIDAGVNIIDKEDTNIYGVDSDDTSEDNSESEQSVKSSREKYSLYGSTSLSDNITLKFGGVFENFRSESDGVYGQKNSSSAILPFLSYNHKFTDKQELRFTYKTYSEYPSLSNMTTLRSMQDEISFITGNPNLVSSWTHKISARATLLGPLLRITPSYQFQNNPISQVGEIIDNKIEYTYKNIGTKSLYGVEVSSQFPIGELFVMDNYFELYREEFNYKNSADGRNQEVNDWVLTSQLIHMNKRYNFMVGVDYQRRKTDVVNSLGYRQNNNSYAGLMFRKQFMKNRLTATAFYILPIDKLGIDYKMKTVIDGFDFHDNSDVDVSILKNSAIIMLNYRFGKNSKNVKRDRSRKSYEKESSGKSIM